MFNSVLRAEALSTPRLLVGNDEKLMHYSPTIFTLLLLALPLSAQPREPMPTGLEEIILLVEVSSVGTHDLLGRVSGDTLYLPFADFCDYLRIPYSLSPDGETLAGEAPVGTPFRIALGEQTLERDSIVTPFDPAAIHEEGGLHYLRLDLVAAAIDVPMEFDPVRQALSVRASPNIPLVELTGSRSRYRALAPESGKRAGVAGGTISRALFGSSVFEWEIGSGLADRDMRTTARLRLAGELLYGIANIGGSAMYLPGDSIPLGAALDHIGWTFQIPDWNLLSRISLNASLAGSSDRYTLDVTNVPLTSRQSLGYHDLTGRSEPGWTVELYDRATLVAVTTADSLGRYIFSLPVGYGTITRTITQVGPHGERVTEQRTLQMNRSLIPPGTADYAIRLQTDVLAARGIVDGDFHLGIGILPWMSIGAEARMPPLRADLVHYDSLAPSATMDLWLGGTSSLGFRFDPRASVLSTLFQTMLWRMSTMSLAIDSVSMEREGYAIRGEANILWGDVLLAGSIGLRSTAGGRDVGGSPTISGALLGVRYSVGTRLHWWAPQADLPVGVGTAGMRASSMLELNWSPVWRTTLGIRSEYDHIARALGRLDVSARFDLPSGVGLHTAYTVHDLDWKRASLNAQLTVDLGIASMITDGSYQENHLSGYSSLAGAGSISAGGIRFERNTTLGASSIVLRAFEDTDGNGKWDDGERELGTPRALLRTDWTTFESSDGWFRYVTPNLSAIVEVDGSSFLEEGLFPSMSVLPIYTLPSTVLTVDIACVRGFEVTGTAVVRSSDDSTSYPPAILNGLTIRLVSTTGNGEYSGQIFNGGEIVIDGAPAGAYTVECDAAQLSWRRIGKRSMQSPVEITEQSPKLPEIVFEAGGR